MQHVWRELARSHVDTPSLIWTAGSSGRLLTDLTILLTIFDCIVLFDFNSFFLFKYTLFQLIFIYL